MKRNGKYGLVTPQNKMLIKPTKYDLISSVPVHRRLFFFAAIGEKWGQITPNGKIMISIKYDKIMPYYGKDDNSVVVLLDGQWMRIDQKGKEIERYDKNPYDIDEEELIFIPSRGKHPLPLKEMDSFE